MQDPVSSSLRPFPPLPADLAIRTTGAHCPPPPPNTSNLIQRARRVSRIFVFCTLLSLLLMGLCEYIVTPVFLALLQILVSGAFPAAVEVFVELYVILVYVVAFLFPYLLYAHLIGFRLRSIPRRRVHPPVLFSCMGLAMGASHLGLLLTAVLLVAASFVGLNPPELSFYFPENVVACILMLLNATLLPAIIEELIYRGIVLHSLRPFGNAPAVLISSLFFGLMHQNMLQFPHAFVLGLLLGYVVIQTGSIYTGIFIHFVNNLIASLLSLGAQHFDSFANSLLSLGQFALYLFAAIAALVYLSKRRASWNMPVSAPGTPPPTRILAAFFKSIPMAFVLLLFIFSLWSSYLVAG